jgi:hypothetical protein
VTRSVSSETFTEMRSVFATFLISSFLVSTCCEFKSKTFFEALALERLFAAFRLAGGVPSWLSEGFFLFNDFPTAECLGISPLIFGEVMEVYPTKTAGVSVKTVARLEV